MALIEKQQALKTFESNNTLIGLILIGLIVMVHSYHSKRPIIKENLIVIKGELKDRPRLISWGGEMSSYEIELNLSNYKNKDFSLVNCGYDLVNENEILDLKEGQAIELTTDRTEFKSDSDVKVYSLIIDGVLIFNVADYNKCYTNYWKRIVPIIIITLIILVCKVIYEFVKTERANKKIR